MIELSIDTPVGILHVYKDAFPPVEGGIEKQIDLIRRNLPEARTDVLVCARGARTRSEPVVGGLEIRAAEYGPRWLGSPAAPSMPYWIRRLAPDLIHLHMPNPTGEIATLLARSGRPLVVSYHADVVRQARFERLYRPLVDACLGRASAVIAGSSGLAASSAALRRHSEKVRVIAHAVDTERYNPEAADPERRERIRRRYGRPIVLAVGRIVYYKGLEYLVEAARGLDAAVVIVGDGPERERIAQLAADQPNVHLTGRLSEADLVDHLAAADCFALASTSRAESFGIAVAEAQSMRLPAVVADTGAGTADSIEDGVTGLLVPTRDPRALRGALRDLLADESTRERMGAAARKRAIARHALHDRMRELRDLYGEVVGTDSR
ncbi:MAG: glycosyltransferase [Solirubrobacterales bacterium]